MDSENPDWGAALAMEFFSDLKQHGLLKIDKKKKNICYSETGITFLRETESKGSENMDMLDLYLTLMVYCGEIFRSEDRYWFSISENRIIAYDPAFPTPLEWLHQQYLKTRESRSLTGTKSASGNSVALAKVPITPKTKSTSGRSLKIWTLITPEGEDVVVENLSHWIGENYRLFGYETDDAVEYIYKNFREIARHMKKGDARRSSYKGWRLKGLPF